MSFGNKTVSKKQFPPIPVGVYPARCYSVVDLGTQETEWKGEKKQNQQIQITWEIPSLMEVFSEEKGEQPRVIGRTYNWSFGKKSNLVKDMSSWLDWKKYQEPMQEWFDKYLLGEPCLLNIGHSDDDLYANIDGIMPMPKGMKCDPAINPTILFEMGDFNEAVFDKLPDWLKKKIEKSPEYQGRNKEEQVGFRDSTADLPF